jgi:hypothetical protein
LLGGATADVAFVKLPVETADVAFVKLPVETADVAFVKLPVETADVAFVKLLGVGIAKVTLVVKFAKGANILEEFIVPSTNLPSMTPDGSVEFKNETST